MHRITFTVDRPIASNMAWDGRWLHRIACRFVINWSRGIASSATICVSISHYTCLSLRYQYSCLEHKSSIVVLFSGPVASRSTVWVWFSPSSSLKPIPFRIQWMYTICFVWQRHEIEINQRCKCIKYTAKSKIDSILLSFIVANAAAFKEWANDQFPYNKFRVWQLFRFCVRWLMIVSIRWWIWFHRN